MTVVTNVVNIVLNLVFVLGLHARRGRHCRVVGVRRVDRRDRRTGRHQRAAAPLPRPAARRARCAAGPAWRPLLAVNRDILIRSLALQGVFFAVTVLGTRMGDSVVAANALLLNGLLLTAFALDGLANAVEALTGHAVGAGDRDALRRALVVAGGWSLIGSVLFALCFGLAGRLFVDLQTDIASVRVIAYHYLPYLTVLPLVGVWSYLLDGLFVGATRAREMRDAMLVAGIAFVLLVFVLRGLGNHGLWLAFLGFMPVRAGTMAWMAWRIAGRDGWVSASHAQAD